MFKHLLILCALSFFSIVRAQENDARDFINIPGPLELDNSEYFLVWSKPVSKTLFRQQYLPRDEKTDSFNQLVEISYFDKEIDIEMAVKQKVESVQARASKDKYAKAEIIESPDGKEFIVDAFISETPKEGSPFVEYNIYRFKELNFGNRKGFLILNLAKRMYGDLRSASKTLAKQRDRLLTSMIEYQIPEVKVSPLAK